MDFRARCPVHRHHWGGQRVQGCLHRQARIEMCLRRRELQRAARLHFPDREPDDDRDGPLDGEANYWGLTCVKMAI